MITPVFELDQDQKFVYVTIKTPYVKVSNVEYFIEDFLFKFYVKPYFLRLNFPGKIVENGEESASYDVDKGLFTVKLPKKEQGCHFPDLDLITKLLAPSGQANITNLVIEVISDHNDHENVDNDEDIDWEWPQHIPDEQISDMNGGRYGFADQKYGIFLHLKDELKDVVENPNPDELTFSERTLARTGSEELKFDPDYYLADYFENDNIQCILNYEIVIKNQVLFSDDEKMKLMQFPNKEYILDSKEVKCVLFSLVDILFAYAYNNRTTMEEHTVESAWTISTLSSTLSWFQRFTNLHDVFIACYRRALSYPLHRHWELCGRIVKDVQNILNGGRRCILKCLLDIHSLFNSSDPRYILNELYITDYCIWIQKVKEKKIESLAKKISMVVITKENVGLDLKEIEEAALIVQEEEEEEEISSSEESSESETSGGESDESSESSAFESDSSNDEMKQSTECHDTPTDSCSNVGDLLETYPASNESSNMNKGNGSQDPDPEKRSIEILPSLLFGEEKSNSGKLITIIDDDIAETNNGSNDQCSNDQLVKPTKELSDSFQKLSVEK